MIGIYRIRNLVNDKCYYGSAKNIKRRWSKHKSQLKNNRHENIILQRAWDRYGEENFVFEVIEECNETILLATEQKYLNSNPEYNIGKESSGGDNITNHPNKNKIIQKRKIKTRKKINGMSADDKKKIWSRPKESNGRWKGGVSIKYCECGQEIGYNSNTCSKCRNRNGENNPFYNKQHTEETKNKLSESRKGKYNGNQNIRFSINGFEYNSLGDASKKLNTPTTTIRWRLKSKNTKFSNYMYV